MIVETHVCGFIQFASARSEPECRLAKSPQRCSPHPEYARNSGARPSRFPNYDTSIVVFGSLAREEFTPRSDIDWTLLVDGVADPLHLEQAHKIEEAIATFTTKRVGQEGTFGNLAFSHELVHRIGG